MQGSPLCLPNTSTSTPVWATKTQAFLSCTITTTAPVQHPTIYSGKENLPSREPAEEGMSLRIYIIPTGDFIQSTGPPPTSLEGLRSWVAEATNIPTHDQILLTPKGRHVKLQTLLTEVGGKQFEQASMC